ncbi:MAG: glycosyltransferase family 4 protein [Actinomycetota bacterium]
MPDRTHVLVVNDSMMVGGAERVAVDIANTLDRNRFRVTFCSTRSGGPLTDVLTEDTDHVSLGRTATWDLRKVVAFSRLVSERQIDLIHSHGRGSMKFVALARLSGLVRTPHLFHDHFGRLHLDRSAPIGLREALRRGVDTYVGVDERLCDWARRTIGLDPTTVHLVRSGVDLTRFDGIVPADIRSIWAIPDDAVVFAMAANFRQQKDHPTLFRAMAALPKRLIDRMHLLAIGSTEADADYFAGCLRMLDDFGLRDHVTTTGARNDVPELLAGADAGVLCAKNETGPLVVLEYMASSLPFVATDTGEVTRAVRGLDIGWTPAPRDAIEVADALADALEMRPDERVAMGVRGRRIAEELFSQPSVTASVEAIYDETLERLHRPVPVGKST